MVITVRKMVTITEAKRIAREANGNAEIISQKLDSLPTRQPKPPAPEGGISLSDAEHKYNIPNETISRWVKRGYIPIIKRTRREVYIEESAFSKIADIYKKDAGRGSWVIKKSFSNSQA
jgi:hypothetical protein